MKRIVPIILTVVITSACAYFSPGIRTEEELFTDKYLKANLTFLASDELEGRETTKRGEKLASLYIAAELKKYGIEPLGDGGTYFQNFPVVVSGLSESSRILFKFDSSSVLFKPGEDFVRSSWLFPSDKYFNKETEVVFAGYGIDAPEFEFNDYAGLDVEGKTVLLLYGEPESDDEDYFDGEKTSKYYRPNVKARIAADKGAAGVVFFPDSNVLKYWKRYSSWTKSESFRYSANSAKNSGGIPVFTLNDSSANLLLSKANIGIDKLKNYLDDYRRPYEFNLNFSVNFKLEIYSEEKYARNVVGVLPGKDDSLQSQYVVLSAHYDHLGKRGGDIYNGADDDGSGTAVLLDAARTLSSVRLNKRSILFVFHTGEEKGLLGSRFFTENFEFMDKILADINIDMVGRGSADTVYNIGSGKLSEDFYLLVRKANEELAKFVFNYKFDDPKDPNRFYYRSDHINFAKKGIPVVFFYDYMLKDYHRPTDTVEKINFVKLAKMVALTHRIVLKTANLKERLRIEKKE